MPDSSKPPLENLSDQALLNEFGELVRQDHQRVASLLRHIDVIDQRKLGPGAAIRRGSIFS